MRLSQERTKRIDVPGDPDGGYVNIRLLTLHQIAQIEAKCNSTGYSERNEVMLSIDPFNRENLIAKSCLIGWGNMFDAKGKEMKFNQKNLREAEAFVIQVDDKKVRFLEWVDDEHSKFYEENEEEAKVASKN